VLLENYSLKSLRRVVKDRSKERNKKNHKDKFIFLRFKITKICTSSNFLAWVPFMESPWRWDPTLMKKYSMPTSLKQKTTKKSKNNLKKKPKRENINSGSYTIKKLVKAHNKKSSNRWSIILKSKKKKSPNPSLRNMNTCFVSLLFALILSAVTERSASKRDNTLGKWLTI